MRVRLVQVALALAAACVVAIAQPVANFVAGGGSGNAEPFHTLAWSKDGVTWNGLGNAIFDTSTTSVSYCAVLDVWVATGGNLNTVAYSGDGKNWTGLGNAAISTNGQGVHWYDGVFIAVGGGGQNTMARSIDGQEWEGLGARTFDGQGYSVRYSRKTQRWVAVGCCTNVLAYSNDGITWVGLGKPLRTFGGGAGTIAFSDPLNLWVAGANDCCFERKTLAFSSNGIDWSLADEVGPSPFFNMAWDVMWDDRTAQFVACGGLTGGDEAAPGPTLAVSRNGMNWTAIASPVVGTFASCQGLAYSSVANVWFLLGQNLTGGIMATSPDLVKWAVQPAASLFSMFGWTVRSRTVAAPAANGAALPGSAIVAPASRLQMSSTLTVAGDLGVPGELKLQAGSKLSVEHNLVLTGATTLHSDASVRARQLKVGPEARLTLAVAAPTSLTQFDPPTVRTFTMASFSSVEGVSKNPPLVVAADACTELSAPCTLFQASALSVTVTVRRTCDASVAAGNAEARLSAAALAGIVVGACVVGVAALVAVVGAYWHFVKGQSAMDAVRHKIESARHKDMTLSTDYVAMN